MNYDDDDKNKPFNGYYELVTQYLQIIKKINYTHRIYYVVTLECYALI